METEKSTEVVVTSELRSGDVVLGHGMRLLIDREIEVSRAHAETPGVGDGKTRYTHALVLNRDDVPNAVVPIAWTSQGDGTHRWTIQGNDLARWYVERTEGGR